MSHADRPFALVDFPLHPTQADSPRRRLAFDAPREWIVARELSEVRPALDAAQRAAQAGAWCVGWVRYEAAPAFDTALRTQALDGPAVCFAVFDQARPWPAATADARAPAYATQAWHDPLSAADFARDVQRIHDWIRAGEVYQINYTTRLSSQLDGDALAYFLALQRSQPEGYAVYLDARQAMRGAAGDVAGEALGERVLSVSPELFFDWHAGHITTQPMKGTAARGATPSEDRLAAERLQRSDKERAENLMIVDLLRNDLARIAQIGSVVTPALFELHALPTVWQMTSTVRATPHPDLRLSDVFAALFPCGSVTGAPKVRAMHRIAELEGEPRGIYCGAVGLLEPGGRATFNVPIRTVTLRGAPTAITTTTAATARCGIGSGITIDAQAEHEHLEWRHKQRFLARAARPFSLLESLRLEDGRIWLLDEHLERLQRSATELRFALDRAAVSEALQRVASQHPRGLFKLRLLAGHAGQIDIEAQPLQAVAPPLHVKLATQAIEVGAGAHAGPPDDFIRHKTTRREIYHPHAAPDGAFDTLLWNADGELTEFTIGNVALHLDGAWCTPPLQAGLLGGTYRRRLLEQGALREAPLQRRDLLRADAVAFFNSVRGWLPVDLPSLQAQARACEMPGR